MKVSKGAVQRTLERFRETGSYSSKPRYGRQCSQNIFAYGFPHDGRGFEQRTEQRTFEKIVYYMLLIQTPPPSVMVIF